MDKTNSQIAINNLAKNGYINDSTVAWAAKNDPELAEKLTGKLDNGGEVKPIDLPLERGTGEGSLQMCGGDASGVASVSLNNEMIKLSKPGQFIAYKLSKNDISSKMKFIDEIAGEEYIKELNNTQYKNVYIIFNPEIGMFKIPELTGKIILDKSSGKEISINKDLCSPLGIYDDSALTHIHAFTFSDDDEDLNINLEDYNSTIQFSNIIINRNIASGTNSHAEGYGTTASGYTSHAEGRETTASGYTSHAEGRETTASGEASHAEGYGTTASSQTSHAEGQNTTASGWASHAENDSTTASGNYSHAEGKLTKALGDNSHAEGLCAKASGDYSHAGGGSYMGYFRAGGRAIASGSIAHGVGTYAPFLSQAAFGYFNVKENNNYYKPDIDYTLNNKEKHSIFVIGNGYLDNEDITEDIGISEEDPAGVHRRDALNIRHNGNMYIQGIGEFNGTNYNQNIKSLQEVIKDLEKRLAVLEKK